MALLEEQYPYWPHPPRAAFNQDSMSVPVTFFVATLLALAAPRLVACQVKYQSEKLEIFWYCERAEFANCSNGGWKCIGVHAWDQSKTQKRAATGSMPPWSRAPTGTILLCALVEEYWNVN